MPVMAASPWTRESPNCLLANASAPMSLLPMRDPNASPFNATTQPTNPIPECLSPNYFSVGVENPGNLLDSNQDPFVKENHNPLSGVETSMPSSGPQLLHQKTWSGTDERQREPITCAPSSNNEVQETEPVSEGMAFPPSSMNYFSPRLLGQSFRHGENITIAREHLNKRRDADGIMSISSPSFGMQRQNLPKELQSLSSQSLQGGERKIAPCNVPGQAVSSLKFPMPRANTLPAYLTDYNGRAISADRCVELLESPRYEVTLLDVRPFAHFARANIKDSLNLCIPTTLLKRRSFDTRKLEGTFTDEAEKRAFARWRQCRFIIVYDAATSDIKDAGPLLNVLKKFTDDGWDGEGLIICGGFNAFSERFPNLIRRPQSQSPRSSSQKPISMNITIPSIAPVVGGCALPESSSAANPFFGNIRQNLDLVGGVGQIAVKLPGKLTESKRKFLPFWLRAASDSQDQGRKVSEKFLDLEKKELERMRQALSYNGPSSSSTSSERFRVAGIEKGTKNRYNDIYPFDHSRVRLQDVPAGDCDYVNANYVKAEYSNKNYIATQAPVPDTFNDFWRVVWEQDVRLIVSLTAEVERGQVKCHPYWKSGDYGPLKLKSVAQRYIYMDSRDSQQANSPQSLSEPNKPSVDAEKAPVEHAADNPFIIVRHFSLSHSAFPFHPLREITQLQYPYWPDFGTTSQPSHLLELIEQCNKVIRATSTTSFNSYEPEPGGQRPVLVHCSAGCGRTGAFCTVDSVLDMLKRQRAEGAIHFQGPANKGPSGGGWVYDEKLDLVAKTVGDFRTQRPSMVQNLSQFVLCYESVLEWVVSQIAEESRSEATESPFS